MANCRYCCIALPAHKKANIYCNQSCAMKHKHALGRFHNYRHGKFAAIERNCKTCDAVLPANRASKGSIYCSHTCVRKDKYKQYINRWLNGEIDGGTWYRVSYHVRRWMIEMFGEKCSICGWNKRNEFTGKIPVHVDHIDGNPYRTVPNNLRFLCPNCHSLTNSFGSANRGKGRKERHSLYRTLQENRRHSVNGSTHPS